MVIGRWRDVHRWLTVARRLRARAAGGRSENMDALSNAGSALNACRRTSRGWHGANVARRQDGGSHRAAHLPPRTLLHQGGGACRAALGSASLPRGACDAEITWPRSACAVCSAAAQSWRWDGHKRNTRLNGGFNKLAKTRSAAAGNSISS